MKRLILAVNDQTGQWLDSQVDEKCTNASQVAKHILEKVADQLVNRGPKLPVETITAPPSLKPKPPIVPEQKLIGGIQTDINQVCEHGVNIKYADCIHGCKI